MAIERAVQIVLRERDDSRVRLTNLDPAFGGGEFRLSHDIPTRPRGDWLNYVQAAAQALVRERGASRGFDAVVQSDIPVAAGLSSSSALVVASGLALIAVNRLEVDRVELMDLMARAERYVGTEGGGMDQAICLGGQEGAALQIDFDPLRLRPVAVPASWGFLVAYSLLRAEKSGEAQAAYNERHADCRHALMRLREAWVADPQLGTITTYASILESGVLDQAIASADATLPSRLARRFRHTLTEARRVRDAVRALEASDIRSFGALMLASHTSLRDDFDVSVPELDEIVNIAMDAGAAGARLTGAGFGGCVVALCEENIIDTVRHLLVTRFYQPRQVTDRLDDCVFTAHPTAGAAYQRV